MPAPLETSLEKKGSKGKGKWNIVNFLENNDDDPGSALKSGRKGELNKEPPKNLLDENTALREKFASLKKNTNNPNNNKAQDNLKSCMSCGSKMGKNHNYCGFCGQKRFV